MDGGLVGDTAGKVITKDTCCPSLSFKGRVIGFASFFIIGFLCSIACLVCFFVTKEFPQMFPLIQIAASIIILCSTFFLCKIHKHFSCETLKKKTRLPAIILTGIGIFGSDIFFIFYNTGVSWHIWLMLVFIMLQIVGSCWYAVSFIPFIEKFIKCCDD